MKRKNVPQKVLAASLALSLLTGCGGTATQESEQPSAAVPTQTQTDGVVRLEADVVVVGGGLSGLTAAAFAAKGGASVILVEKLGLLGGSGLVSSGIMITCESDGLIDGDDSVEHIQDYWTGIAALDESSGYPDMERVNYTLGETGKTVRSMVEMGLTLASATSDSNSSKVSAEGKGPGLIAALQKMTEDLGVTTYMNCKAETLLQQDGEVVGITAVGKEGEMEIKASSVILACGGYSRNDELIAELAPECVPAYNGRACVGNEGDGIGMALSAGAVPYENQWLMMSYCQVDPEFDRQTKANSVLSFNNSLAVDDQGQRIENEAHSAYSAFCNGMLQKGYDHCYALMNATDDTRGALETGVEMGQVVKGTVEEIAEQLHIPADALRTTFDEYRAMCEAGEDSQFGKASERLVKLNGEELYAVTYYPTSIGVLGGVKTDRNGQALREDGSVINGLFAVGEMSNRAFYNYCYIGGASLGLYSTMGRLAGELAAELAVK